MRRTVLLLVIILSYAVSTSTAAAQSLDVFTEAFHYAIDIKRTIVQEIGTYMLALKEGASTVALFSGIGLAFLYGALHALGPGHGKMVVASFFMGQDAKIWRGMFMGLQIAVTHVISAVALVWLVDLSFRHFVGGSPAESVWIRGISFGLIAVIGGVLLIRAIQRYRALDQSEPPALPDHDHHHHGIGQQSLLALLAGLVPCTGAILVMLFALASDIVGIGILLVAAISAGMAITMAIFGVLSILFRRIIMAIAETNNRGAVVTAIVLEHLAALFILLIGISFLSVTLADEFL